MFDIEKFLDLTDYEETRKDRRKGSSATNEFFTPYSIVKHMCDKISNKDWSDPAKTFLDMDNKEVLKENGGKKFDICLMNPPYGSKTQKTSPHLHYQFVEKILDIAKKQVSIFPSRMIFSSSKEYDKYKEVFNKYLLEIEEVDPNLFSDTKMQNVGIFVFNDNKTNESIHIKKIDSTEENINSLFDKGSRFTNYEKEIFKYCKVDKPNFNPFRPLGDDKNKYLEEFCDKYINKRWPNNDKIFLITNITNGPKVGPWPPHFMSSRLGQICKNTKELKELMLQRRGACCTIMTFDSEKAAQNCKIALQNPLMRFFLYRLQDDQNMTARVYVGIPNIDWSDDRVKTDEGLLEVCGCPKDKCKEYADYCKKIIGDVNVDGKYNINDFLDMDNKDILKENGGKKFDVVLMNPPYDRSLHLKFLEKTIQIADNVVSIQPIDFLLVQDYEINKKSKANIWKDLIKHINNIDLISTNLAKDLFNIDSFTELGIIYSTNKKQINNHDFIKELGITDFRNILQKLNNYKDKFENHRAKNIGKYFVPVYNDIKLKSALGNLLFSDNGTLSKRGFTKENIENHGRGMFINFDSQEEANNFKEYCKTFIIKSITYLIRFIGANSSGIIPFMPTYKKQWSDKEICDEIGLTNDEIELIINKYKEFLNQNKK